MLGIRKGAYSKKVDVICCYVQMGGSKYLKIVNRSAFLPMEIVCESIFHLEYLSKVMLDELQCKKMNISHHRNETYLKFSSHISCDSLSASTYIVVTLRESL